MSLDPILAYIFYIVWISLGLLGLVITVQIYRTRITWGRARRMGVPMVIFFWMNAIYGLVLFEGMFGLLSIILEFPIWVDIILFVTILGMTITVYYMLLRRNRFNQTMFITLFLSPLSIPGIHTAAKFIQNSAPIEIVKRSVSFKATPRYPHAGSSLDRWVGQIKIGPVAGGTAGLRRYIEQLHAKQKGMDAVCRNVPLPPLYVGPLWKRKLNSKIEVDHKKPRAKGGTDNVSNLQLTFWKYNRSKRDLTGPALGRAQRSFCPV